jgi:hypothetical protein
MWHNAIWQMRTFRKHLLPSSFEQKGVPSMEKVFWIFSLCIICFYVFPDPYFFALDLSLKRPFVRPLILSFLLYFPPLYCHLSKPQSHIGSSAAIFPTNLLRDTSTSLQIQFNIVPWRYRRHVSPKRWHFSAKLYSDNLARQWPSLHNKVNYPIQCLKFRVQCYLHPFSAFQKTFSDYTVYAFLVSPIRNTCSFHSCVTSTAVRILLIYVSQLVLSLSLRHLHGQLDFLQHNSMNIMISC